MPTINVIGTVGAGKTTLTERLHQFTNLPVGYEGQSKVLDDTTRKLLQRYYQNREAVALEKNQYFLQQRAKTIQQNALQSQFISDRFLYDDYLLAMLNVKNNEMTPSQWITYQQAFRSVEKSLAESHPLSDDILVYVKPSFETALQNIAQRGRQEEQIDNNPNLKSYYETMYELYNQFYDDWQKSPKLIVPSSKNADLQSLINQIKALQPAFKNL